MKKSLLALAAISALTFTVKAQASDEPALDLKNVSHIYFVNKCDSNGAAAALLSEGIEDLAATLPNLKNGDSKSISFQAEDWDSKKKEKYQVTVTYQRHFPENLMTRIVLKDQNGRIVSQAQLISDVSNAYAYAGDGDLYCEDPQNVDKLKVSLVQQKETKK